MFWKIYKRKRQVPTNGNFFTSTVLFSIGLVNTTTLLVTRSFISYKYSSLNNYLLLRSCSREKRSRA